MEWNGMTDSITVKKGKAIADAYNSPDEDFALQNLALQIRGAFLGSSDRTDTTIPLHANAKAKTPSRDPYGYSSVPPLHACTPSPIPLPISKHACTPFSDNGAVFNVAKYHIKNETTQSGLPRALSVPYLLTRALGFRWRDTSFLTRVSS
ncbi:hypothetical protein LXL04_023791 [Taraxacum kok-saghyz]